MPIRIVGRAAFEPYEQGVRVPRQPGQRIQGPLDDLVDGMADDPKLVLADSHQSLRVGILNLKKTGGPY